MREEIKNFLFFSVIIKNISTHSSDTCVPSISLALSHFPDVHINILYADYQCESDRTPKRNTLARFAESSLGCCCCFFFVFYYFVIFYHTCMHCYCAVSSGFGCRGDYV